MVQACPKRKAVQRALSRLWRDEARASLTIPVLVTRLLRGQRLRKAIRPVADRRGLLLADVFGGMKRTVVPNRHFVGAHHHANLERTDTPHLRAEFIPFGEVEARAGAMNIVLHLRGGWPYVSVPGKIGVIRMTVVTVMADCGEHGCRRVRNSSNISTSGRFRNGWPAFPWIMAHDCANDQSDSDEPRDTEQLLHRRPPWAALFSAASSDEVGGMAGVAM